MFLHNYVNKLHPAASGMLLFVQLKINFYYIAIILVADNCFTAEIICVTMITNGFVYLALKRREMCTSLN